MNYLTLVFVIFQTIYYTLFECLNIQFELSACMILFVILYNIYLTEKKKLKKIKRYLSLKCI